MNPAPSRASLTMGSSVPSKVGSLLVFWKSAIRYGHRLVLTGIAGPRANHQVPPRSTRLSTMAAAKSRIPTTRLTRMRSPSSFSQASSSASSCVVW